MSDHYGPWHSHDSASQMGPYIGLADESKSFSKKILPKAGLLPEKNCELIGNLGRYGNGRDSAGRGGGFYTSKLVQRSSPPHFLRAGASFYPRGMLCSVGYSLTLTQIN